MLSGFAKSHRDILVSPEDPRVFYLKTNNRKPRVGVVSGGGSGHDPAFIGYVRPFMLDAVAVGEIFLAPSEETFLHAFRVADRGQGVICLHGNYELDNTSVSRAIELAREEGIEVRRVVANDDVSPRKDVNSRGLAGEVFLWKIGGAAAAKGMTLEEVETVCQRSMSAMSSIGVGLSACTIPEVGVPNFDVVEGTMEVGIGHHGDPGITTYKLRP
ncbi:MAG: dihydroxyacetone kinase subunit DhaK, partial [Lawsonibacter sp.]|nr:dihydroxyacetone kinase subunit DhaK [Lawsonibacter sp.]